MINAITKLLPQSGTALYDAIDIALQEIKHLRDEVPLRFSVVLTDGKDTASKKNADPDLFKNKIRHECRKHFIPLFIVGITDNVNSALLSEIGGFGLYQYITDFSNLDYALQTILKTIKDTFIFKIPITGNYSDLKAIYLIKKRPDGSSETIQDFIPSWEKNIYVTHLSFMDANTLSSMDNTELTNLINDAVINGMKEAQITNPYLAINETGYVIPNTDMNVNNLVNIFFDPNLAVTEKINRIIYELMNPSNVDVIVTGLYIFDENNSKLSIRPILIVKDWQKIFSKNLQLSKADFLSQGQNNKMILYKKVKDSISHAVQELLEQL